MGKIKLFWQRQIRIIAAPLGFSAGKGFNIPWQQIKIDTTAMVIFGLVTSLLTIFYEVIVTGVDLEKWAEVRLLYNAIRFIGAYFLGCLIDWFRIRLNGHWFSKALSDALALSVYQIPIYAFSAWVMGVPCNAIILAAGIYFLDNLFLGWLYGYILDQTRKRFSRKK